MNELERAKWYWRIALSFPLLGALTYPLGTFGLFLGIGMLIIGIPYLLFAALMWALYGRATSVRGILLRAAGWPLFFVPFYIPYCFVAALLRPDAGASEFLSAMLGFAAFTGVFGYGYFILSLAAFGMIEAVIQRDRPDASASHLEPHSGKD